MLGRRKQTAETPAPVTTKSGQGAASGGAGAAGKNRPTPKRRVVQAARKQPLVQPRQPGQRAGRLTKDQRDAQRVERAQARERMMAGDEKYLPVRDRGPVKRYVRDVVDSRRAIGEYLLPLMLVFLVLSYAGGSVRTRGSVVFTFLFALIYLVVVASAVDAFLLTRRVRRQVEERFGAGQWSGNTMYTVMRTFQIRRTRVPRPGVQRGEPPRR